ncbi:4'-phosphopantetheinyl transferase family protein [Burkholderia sp. TSV86]|uniref:4'-phosphopantetheinyl transferase family protein n=1 Tax=Burkholderia sp. TSV86 TaxID=1385594 RepID=UPI00075A19C4|nr:4'-phosphopantetheinyl transferase superfamily protein [Burkholderia sp. TSV86]KVE34094.1 4'-phosphopantetheinyl transferase [Burkholderia sp. TSV86]
MSQPSDAFLPSAHDAAYRAVELTAPDAVRTAGVRLVRLDFNFGAAGETRAFECLSDDEQERAHRFVRTEDALRYAATRAVLRMLLGAALEIPAAALRFVADAHGRPTLAPEHARLAPTLDFNVSHSGGHALIGWSRAARVGVDIEAQREGIDWWSLSRAVFAPADEAALAALPEAEREAAFYRVWAAKEALLKALGTGIGAGLTAFSVLGGEGQPAASALPACDPGCAVSRGPAHRTSMAAAREQGGAALAAAGPALHFPVTPIVRIVDPASAACGVAAFDAIWLDAPAGYAACVAWQRA